jgi:hypothetical protein
MNDQGMTKCMEKQREVPAQLDLLDDKLRNLEATCGRLQDKVAFIRKPRPAKDTEPSCPAEAKCGLAEKIFQNAVNVDIITRRLECMCDEIEL